MAGDTENAFSKIAISRRNYAEVRKKLAKRASARIPDYQAARNSPPANNGFGPSAREQQVAQSRKSLAPVQKLKRVAQAFKSAIHESSLVSKSLRHVKNLQQESSMLGSDERWALLLRAEASGLSQEMRDLYLEMQEDWRDTYAKRLAKIDASETETAMVKTNMSSSQLGALGQTNQLLTGIQLLRGSLDPQALARNYQEASEMAGQVQALQVSLSTQDLSEDAIRLKVAAIEQAERKLNVMFSQLSGVEVTKVPQQQKEPEHSILKSDTGVDPYFPPSLEWSKVVYVDHDVMRHKRAKINAIRATLQLPKKPRSQPSSPQIFEEADEEEQETQAEAEAPPRSEVDGSHRMTTKLLEFEHHDEHRGYNADEGHDASPKVSRKSVKGEVSELDSDKHCPQRLTIKSLWFSRPDISKPDVPDPTDTHKTRISLRRSVGKRPDLPEVALRMSPAPQSSFASKTSPKHQSSTPAQPAWLQEVKMRSVDADLLPIHGSSSSKTPDKLKTTSRIDSRKFVESTPRHKANRTYVRASALSLSHDSEAADRSPSYPVNIDSPQVSRRSHSAGHTQQSSRGDGSPSPNSEAVNHPSSYLININSPEASQGFRSAGHTQQSSRGDGSPSPSSEAANNSSSYRINIDSPQASRGFHGTGHTQQSSRGDGSLSPNSEAADNALSYRSDMPQAGKGSHSAGRIQPSSRGDASENPALSEAQVKTKIALSEDDESLDVETRKLELTPTQEEILGADPFGLDSEIPETQVRTQMFAGEDDDSLNLETRERNAAPKRVGTFGEASNYTAELLGEAGKEDIHIQTRSGLESNSDKNSQALHGTKPASPRRWSKLMSTDIFLSDVIGKEELGRENHPDPDLDQEAWSEPVRYVANYAHSLAFHLGRPLLPDDKLRTKDGNEITYAELKSLTWQNLQAAFPLQVLRVTEEHDVRMSRFPWLSEPRNLHGLLREQDTRTTIEQILFRRRQCGMRELCVSRDMITEWEKFSELVGEPQTWKCSCCRCAKCLSLEVSRPTSPQAIAVRRAAGLPVTPDLLADLEQQSETRAS